MFPIDAVADQLAEPVLLADAVEQLRHQLVDGARRRDARCERKAAAIAVNGDGDALAPLGRELDDDGVALRVHARCAREASPVSAHV
jgi:hypothetical protein